MWFDDYINKPVRYCRACSRPFVPTDNEQIYCCDSCDKWARYCVIHELKYTGPFSHNSEKVYVTDRVLERFREV